MYTIVPRKEEPEALCPGSLWMQRHAKRFHFEIQRIARNTQRPRGPRLVPACGSQCRLNRVLFRPFLQSAERKTLRRQFIQIDRELVRLLPWPHGWLYRRGHEVRRREQSFGKMLHPQLHFIVFHAAVGISQHVFEFTDVARPGIVHEQFEDLRRQTDLKSFLRATDSFNELGEQRRYIALALTQWREPQLKDIQPVALSFCGDPAFICRASCRCVAPGRACPRPDVAAAGHLHFPVLPVGRIGLYSVSFLIPVYIRHIPHVNALCLTSV